MTIVWGTCLEGRPHSQGDCSVSSYLEQPYCPISPGTLGTIGIVSLKIFCLWEKITILVPSSIWDLYCIIFILTSSNYEVIHFWEAQAFFVLDREVKCTVHITIPLSRRGWSAIELEPVVTVSLPSPFQMPGMVQLQMIGWSMPRGATPPSGQTGEARWKWW